MQKIILIDADAAYRTLLRALVEMLGYAVVDAADAEHAFALLGEAPRGVLLGWDPADPAGLDFVRRLRADRALRSTPVILMPAQATRAQVVEAVAVGIQGVLLKRELEPGRLRVAIRRAVPQTGVERPSAVVARPVAAGTPAPVEPRGTAEEPASVEAPAPTTAEANSLRELRPIHSRASFLDRLSEIGHTKALPPTLTQLMRMLRNPDCSIDTVTEVISHDQSVAIKILKLANSAVYSRGDAVTSVKDAVLRIGLERIQQAVLNIGVVEQFGVTGVSEHFNFVHFWEHAICCGLIASGLGRVTNSLDPDKAFALGLLHDVGRMVLIEHFPEEYAEVLEAADRLDLPLEQVESRLLLLNHAAVVERVMHNWGFPKDLIGPMANHHLSASNLREHAGKQLQETAILALANRLSHAILVGSSGNDAVYPTEALCQLLRVSAKDVAEVLEAAEEETRQIKFALLMVSDQQPWPSVLARRRSEVIGSFRPLYIGDDEGLDAFRIVTGRLADEGDKPPNVAVVRLDSKRQVVRLGVMLAARETELGLQPLPTILISPGGEQELDYTQMVRRRAVKVPAPLTMRRLIQTVNRMICESAQREADAA
jgi:HD-like signal output (HDOD) protein/CheY-like chemotaxis protein